MRSGCVTSSWRLGLKSGRVVRRQEVAEGSADSCRGPTEQQMCCHRASHAERRTCFVMAGSTPDLHQPRRAFAAAGPWTAVEHVSDDLTKPDSFLMLGVLGAGKLRNTTTATRAHLISCCSEVSDKMGQCMFKVCTTEARSYRLACELMMHAAHRRGCVPLLLA